MRIRDGTYPKPQADIRVRETLIEAPVTKQTVHTTTRRISHPPVIRNPKLGVRLWGFLIHVAMDLGSSGMGWGPFGRHWGPVARDWGSIGMDWGPM